MCRLSGLGGSEGNAGRGRGKKKIRSTARFVAVQQAVSPQDVAEGGGGGVTWAGWVVDRVDSGGDGEELESPAVQSALLSTVEMRGGGLGVEMCRGGIVRVKWARGPPPPLQSPPLAGNRCPVHGGWPAVRTLPGTVTLAEARCPEQSVASCKHATYRLLGRCAWRMP